MSVPSELSSILTNANWAMYQNGVEEPLHVPSNGPDPVMREVGLSAVSTPYTTNMPETLRWYQLAPQHWTKQHVLEWISSHVEENQFDANFLNMACCSIDGPTLCQLSHEAMVTMYGTLGQTLHQNLQELLMVKNGAEDLSGTWDFFDEFFGDLPDILSMQSGDNYRLLSTVVVNDDQRSSDFAGYQDVSKMTGGMTPQSDNGYESGSASLDSSYGTGNLKMPSSPDSGNSDSDPEFADARFSLSAADHTNMEKEQIKTHKRGRGRPRKVNYGPGHFLETTKTKHSARGAHLWEFIRDILICPELNHGLMKWEDRKEGVFKFLKSEAVAQLWGQKKRNTSMTYEKLSRAMRYYYKREILERVDGRRLVYKFGKNASGWKVEETGQVL